MVQLQSSNEADLRNFFIKYGPSARDCYDVTTTEGGLISYDRKLTQDIARMTWDDINRIVSENFEPKFDDETSLLVALIQPADDKRRIIPRTSFITRTVLRLLWKTHRRLLKRRYSYLFQTFSGKPPTSVGAGWLFEAMIHDLLEEGIAVPIDPMIIEKNNRPNHIPVIDGHAVNDKYMASNTDGTKTWQSSAMEYVPFIQYDRDLDIQPLHYYVPVDPSHPTYDLFTFELAPCASYEGPILNPKDKRIYDKADLDEVSFRLFLLYDVHSPIGLVARPYRIPTLHSSPSFK